MESQVPPSATPQDVLDFWFTKEGIKTGIVPPSHSRLWWVKDKAFDEEIRTRFGGLVAAASTGGLDHWKTDLWGQVAFVIVADQFSRNIFRGSPQAFALDGVTAEVVVGLIHSGQIASLPPIVQCCMLLVLEHQENVQLQRTCCDLLEKLLAANAGKPVASAIDGFLNASQQHRTIIERFGRFPHRNQVLGRTSTAEELEFLKLPGSSF